MQKRFYTIQEIKELKAAIRTGECLIKIAAKYSDKWDRKILSVYQKVVYLSKHTNKIAVNKSKVVKTSVRKEAKIIMPKGFTFDFTPKRAEMYKDRVVLYF